MLFETLQCLFLSEASRQEKCVADASASLSFYVGRGGETQAAAGYKSILALIADLPADNQS